MKRFLPLIIVALLVLGFAQNPLFVVNEGEQALVTEFGKPVGGVLSPGLHVKVPFIQTVHRFETRILKWDGDPNQIPTKDKRYIFLDTTARWRIADPLLFFKTVASERGAQGRLDDIIDSVVRDAVSGHLLVELVRGSDYQAPGSIPEEIQLEGVVIAPELLVGREEILDTLLEKARASTPEYGIDLIDVQIKRINYVEQVRQRVYERMISERKKVAAQFRSEGEGDKADILGQMDKELKGITSEAYRKSVEIRGAADAEAAGIYSAAYGSDREFYAFLRTLESYRKSVGKNGKLVMSTDSDFYRYLQKMK
ncbi:MAG: HflC protein [Desulfuromonadales bacterium C00003107]|jgi:membrane protease subunit HflC|nr:MAG: HflC protein [Desulfuromonadales bacterium C00003107]